MTATQPAIALCEPDHDSRDLGQLAEHYDLRIVHTVFIHPASPHAPAIAVQEVLTHDAGYVLVPGITSDNARTVPGWRVLLCIAHLITSTGLIECNPDDLPIE